MSGQIITGTKTITEVNSDIAKHMASLATIFVFCSIVHEYTYFWTIGREFMNSYGIVDFAKTTVSWLPLTLVLGSLGIIVNFYDLNARFEAARKFGDAGLAAWDKPDKAIRYLNIFILIITAIAIPFMRWDNLYILQLPVYFGVSLFIGNQIVSGRLPLTNRPAESLIFYCFIGWLLVSAMFGGMSEGIRDMKRDSPTYSISIKDEIVEAVILRIIDKDIIYKRPNSKRISLVNWKDVIEMKSQEVIISDTKLYQYLLSFF